MPHSADGAHTAEPKPIYGNYRAYYRRRQLGPHAAQQDPRLHSLFACPAANADSTRPPLQRVLDIGCNSGRVTIQLASLLEPAPVKVIGIDLDAELIRQAKNSLRYTWSRRRPTQEWEQRLPLPPAFENREHGQVTKRRRTASTQDQPTSTRSASDDQEVVDPQALENLRFFPACFPSLLGSLSFPVSNGTPAGGKVQSKSALSSAVQDPPSTFPTNCHFVVADVMDKSLHQRNKWCAEGEKFDLIVCLSLTKWVHVHHGDMGLLDLLDEFARIISPHGLLLLEPHGESSYERTKELPTAVRKALAEKPLEIKPMQLPQLLRQRGFHLMSRTPPEQPNHGAPGREVLLFEQRP